MKLATISRGGQVSIPADVRRRWQTTRLALEDRGHELVLRPIPADPIGAAMGSLAGPGPSTDAARALLRAEEARTERQRTGRERGRPGERSQTRGSSRPRVPSQPRERSRPRESR